MEPFFFGYGSLVNRATHAYPRAARARLSGWRRVWRQTNLREVAFLSVEPADGAIDGLVAAVPNDDWAELDLRESAYDRVPVDVEGAPPRAAVAVYRVPDGVGLPQPATRLLLSYVDVVVQGFLREYGEAGVARFFETTAGWAWVEDDRAAPRYARSQRLSAQERALVDRWLGRVA